MIRVRALGQCVVEVGEHHVTPEADVLFALLLVLSSSAGHSVARADLLDLLWPDCAPSKARHRLRQALYQLKKLGVPVATPDSAIAVRESDVEVDYVTCGRNRQAFAESFCDSVTLDYLPSYAPTFSRRFARWVDGERDRVRGTIRRYLLDLARERRARGDHANVIAIARACLQLDPLNGEATFALAESLAVQGSKAEALGVLDHYRLERQASDEETTRATAALRRRIVELARKPDPSAAAELPLVGRSGMVAELKSWIASGSAGSQILAFVGEAGIGKTRLLNEGVRIATLRGIRCVEYRPGTGGGERPLAGLIDLLPQLLALPGAVGCSPESFARLTGLARGVHDDGSIPEDRTDSIFRFARLRRSVLDLFEAILGEGELILSLDDAHALDRPTLEILIDATRCSGHRVALMVAVRPLQSALAFLEPRTDVRMVRVPPLEAGDARSIVVRDLDPGVAAKRPALIDWAVDLANGNPFFLVELSAHCRSENARELLPQSLQIALDRKIEALTPNSRLVLQSFAILGDHSSLGRIEMILGLPPHATATALSELEDSGLIAFRNGRVLCRHDLVVDAVLRSVKPALGSFLHRRCATLLDDELRSSPSASMAWDCARHWDAADEHTRALELTGEIVDQLLSLGFPKEAADLCVRAERYCRTPEDDAERLKKLSRARRLLYDWDGVVESLTQRGAALASAGVKRQKFSDDEIWLFEAKWWRDCHRDVLRPSIQRVADVRAPALHRLQMAVLALIVADNHHRPRDASKIIDVVESLDVDTVREDIERLKARVVYHTAFGSLEEALAAGAQLVDFERRGGDSAALLRALRWSSCPLRLANDRGNTVAALTEAYQKAHRLGLRAEMWNAAYHLQGAAIDWEDLGLALDWVPIFADLEPDLTVNAVRGLEHNLSLARIEYLTGDFAKARLYLERARSVLSAIPRTRGEHAILALDVLLLVRTEARRIPSALLQRLYSLHLKTRDSGIRDFESAALVAGLLYSGNRTEAQAVNDYYMRVRRSRIDNHATLQWVQSQLNP